MVSNLLRRDLVAARSINVIEALEAGFFHFMVLCIRSIHASMLFAAMHFLPFCAGRFRGGAKMITAHISAVG